MPVDFKKNILFIHIPKTGGSSISEYLKIGKGNYLFGPETVVVPDEHGQLKKLHRWWRQHATVKEIIKYNVLSSQQCEKLFKFAFVRNPYDRAVSNFLYFKGMEKIPSDLTFREFLINIKYQIRSQPEEHLDISTLNEFVPYCHIRPQVDYISDLNYVGRYENLLEDFSRLCNKYQLNDGLAAKFDKSKFPHKKRTNGEHYTKYYNFSNKHLLEEIYYEDLEYLKYNFYGIINND